MNYVIFRPYQKKLTYQPKIYIFDNEQNKSIELECKDYVKYLGILIDNNLSWRHHIDQVALKISKIVGLIAKRKIFSALKYSSKYLPIFNCSLLDVRIDCMGSCM